MPKRDPLILGIDLGGTKILTSIVNSKGEMLSRDHSLTPAAKGSEGVIRAILASAERALHGASIAIDRVSGVGIGAPGLADPKTGILFTSPNLPGWEDVPLRDILQAKLKKSTFLINDGNAGALGEYYFGAAKGAAHFVYVTISTGIGGGIVIDGKILNGCQGMAGEIGHMTIADEGPPCRCGNRGCWEALASGTALANAAKKRIEMGEATAILGFAEGKSRKRHGEDRRIRRGKRRPPCQPADPQNRLLFWGRLGKLGQHPQPRNDRDRGRPFQPGRPIAQACLRAAEKRAFNRAYRAVRFVPAALGRNSGVLGAAAYAFEEMKGALREPGGKCLETRVLGSDNESPTKQ